MLFSFFARKDQHSSHHTSVLRKCQQQEVQIPPPTRYAGGVFLALQSQTHFTSRGHGQHNLMLISGTNNSFLSSPPLSVKQKEQSWLTGSRIKHGAKHLTLIKSVTTLNPACQILLLSAIREKDKDFCSSQFLSTVF